MIEVRQNMVLGEQHFYVTIRQNFVNEKGV